jgi:hypothetical protein
MYPSITNDYVSQKRRFLKRNIEKSIIFSSDYATRGFDMTFDTMMRLVQNKSFEELNSAATQQVENKFEYYKKKENGGYTNKGVL